MDKAYDVMILDDSQDLSQAANAIINPVTAVLQLDRAREYKATACVVNAASSQLGKQFLRLCQKEGIEVINIVRREEQVKQLKEDY